MTVCLRSLFIDPGALMRRASPDSWARQAIWRQTESIPSQLCSRPAEDYSSHLCKTKIAGICAVRTLYGEVPKEAVHLHAWLDLGGEAKLPVAEPDESTLRRTEQRLLVLQLERLMGYPIVRRCVGDGSVGLHGWHYVIEEGEVHTLDIETRVFTPAAAAQRSSTMGT